MYNLVLVMYCDDFPASVAVASAVEGGRADGTLYMYMYMYMYIYIHVCMYIYVAIYLSISI